MPKIYVCIYRSSPEADKTDITKIRQTNRNRKGKKMKQTIITLLVIASFLSGCGSSTASIFTDFKDKPNADFVYVPKAMMKLGMAFAGKGGNTEEMDIARHISSVKVLDMSGCDAATRHDFSSAVSDLSLKGYEEIVRVKDSADDVKILVKRGGGYIRELLVANSEPDDAMLVEIKGKIKPEDIGRLIEQQTKKRKP